MLLKAFKWRVSAQDHVLQANNFEGRKPLQITSFTKITYFTEIGKKRSYESPTTISLNVCTVLQKIGH